MREKLPQALEALDKIKHEYRRFYDESMDETRSFDSGMRALLGEIDELICLRLDLGRGPAEVPDAAEGEAEAATDEAAQDGDLAAVRRLLGVLGRADAEDHDGNPMPRNPRQLDRIFLGCSLPWAHRLALLELEGRSELEGRRDS